MKISNFILMSATALVLASCGGSSETEKAAVAEVTKMSLDTETSVLNWKGMKSAEDFHTGAVKFLKGSAEMVDGNMTSGEFTIDMANITVTDAGMPDDKKAMLAGHLAAADFFNTAEGKVVSVKTGALENGMLPITISILGQEIKETVPAKLIVSGAEASLKGTFDVDFSSLDRPGFKPQKGQTEFVQPKISFDLDIKLK